MRKLCVPLLLISSVGMGADEGVLTVVERKPYNYRDIAVAVVFDDMANFSHYVDRSLLRDIATLNGYIDETGQAKNFRIQAQKYGHIVSFRSSRVKHWNNTTFDNFAMESLSSHSVDAHNAHWSNFYISGSVSDWEFQDATLENGWFNAQMKNCNFKGAHLKNIGFYGAKLGKTRNLLKRGKGIRFDGAILENVTFKGSIIKRASFKGATFRSNVYFHNANVHFATQFAGAKFINAAGNEQIITREQADKLDRVLTNSEAKTITSANIWTVMTQ